MSEKRVYQRSTLMPTTIVRSAWSKDRRISLAAFGLLVRLNDHLTHNDAGTELVDVVGPGELAAAEPLVAELTRAGYLVDGNLTDPHAVSHVAWGQA